MPSLTRLRMILNTHSYVTIQQIIIAFGAAIKVASFPHHETFNKSIFSCVKCKKVF